MQPNSHDFDKLSELLSAYLDGEVTAEERALVEEQLAANGELRQLHEELKAMRTAIENLPRYQLQENLAPSVLRRAEKTLLAATAVEDLRAGVSESNDVALAEPIAPRDRVARVLRNMRWSLVAVAIAVVIMVFNREQEEAPREVAKVARTAEMDRTAVISAAPEDKADRIENIELKRPDLGVENRFNDTVPLAVPAPMMKKGEAAALPQKAMADAESADVQSQQGLLIVFCDTKREAAAAQAFEQLLANQKITVQSSGSDSNEAQNEIPNDRKTSDVAAEEAAPPDTLTSSKSHEVAGKAASRRSAETLDAYLVEASPQQIEATLNGLSANKEWFSTVAVQATPTANQLSFFARSLSESGGLRTSLKDSGSYQAPAGGAIRDNAEDSRRGAGNARQASPSSTEVLSESLKATEDFDRTAAESAQEKATDAYSRQFAEALPATAQRLHVEAADFLGTMPNAPGSEITTDSSEGAPADARYSYSDRFAGPAENKLPAQSAPPARMSQSTLQHGAPAAPPAEQVAPLSAPTLPAPRTVSPTPPAKLRVLFVLRPAASSADSK